MQRTVQMLCVSVCVCAVVILIVKKVNTPPFQLSSLLPETLTGIQHSSGANWNNLHFINRMICFPGFYLAQSGWFSSAIFHHISRNPLQQTHQTQKRLVRSKCNWICWWEKSNEYCSSKWACWMTSSFKMNVFGMISKGGNSILVTLDLRDEKGANQLIKYMGHCPIIRGVISPQHWLMDPMIVVGL